MVGSKDRGEGHGGPKQAKGDGQENCRLVATNKGKQVAHSVSPPEADGRHGDGAVRRLQRGGSTAPTPDDAKKATRGPAWTEMDARRILGDWDS